jgi:hydroxymethylpyrimidine kinase / phosphomethylpyrimidine kinase / thiamine-phosphate diphosphorylase
VRVTLAIPRGEKKPIVWTIAGSDSSGGAGLQADLKTLATLGAHACTIITAVTAQNSGEVRGFESVSPAMLAAQIEALSADMPPGAIKIGMLGNADGVRILAETLGKIGAYTVYDPVMISSSGTQLLNDETLSAMRAYLLPRVDLLTPNLAEAEALTNMKIHDDEDVEQAAADILKMGVKAVLIKSWNAGKGFHQDYYSNGAQKFWLTLPQSSNEVPRGTGCALSSVLAAAHAFGFDEPDAAVIAKAYVRQLLRDNRKLGKGPPIAEHRPWPAASKNFPWLTPTAEAGHTRPLFPDCDNEPLGFYPIVDSAAWLQRLLPLGVRTAQVRVKDLQGAALEEEIRAATALARRYGMQLFVNDDWQLAIKHGAYGAHLGQEDLAGADIAALEASGLRLGISTHSYAEAARAKALNPSYIALGPIFPTTLKAMKFAPQGIETLRIWRRLFDCPLVAIGGITCEKAPEIFAAGASAIAVVSDITQNADPEGRVKQWLQFAEVREGAIGERHRLSALA